MNSWAVEPDVDEDHELAPWTGRAWTPSLHCRRQLPVSIPGSGSQYAYAYNVNHRLRRQPQGHVYEQRLEQLTRRVTPVRRMGRSPPCMTALDRLHASHWSVLAVVVALFGALCAVKWSSVS
jgi:hypothetical protein